MNFENDIKKDEILEFLEFWKFEKLNLRMVLKNMEF